jgi:hypothetical protein
MTLLMPAALQYRKTLLPNWLQATPVRKYREPVELSLIHGQLSKRM